MFDYNICTQADDDLFERQCDLIKKIPGITLIKELEDVTGTKRRIFAHPSGNVTVVNDRYIDALYAQSEFDLLPYFHK